MFGIGGVSHQSPIRFCSKEPHHVIVRGILTAGSSVGGAEKSICRKTGWRKTYLVTAYSLKGLNDVYFRLDGTFYEAVRSQAADID
jgi:hypothetical protein